MKNILIIAITAVTMSMTANAQQKGDMAVGGNLLFGEHLGKGSFSNVGIGAKFFYNVTDPIRLAGEFDFFLPKHNTSMWDLSVYGHYLIPVADKFTAYPSVGFGLIGASYSFGGFSDSNSDFALSLGGGADYELTSNLSLNAELRFKISEGNRLNFAIGVAYKF